MRFQTTSSFAQFTPTLKVGQVVKYGQELYRVELVNDCRAKIVPLKKRHVLLPNGAEFESERGGINIAPDSLIEVIDNIEEARDRMELAAVEAEAAELRRELVRREKMPQEKRPQDAVCVAQTQKAAPPTNSVKREHASNVKREHASNVKREHAPSGGGWYVVDPGNFKPGTLAETVMTFIVAFPGKSTAEIVAGVQASGAVAACVSRFHQAGLIEKR